MSGLHAAIRASEIVMPPQLVQEYIHIAPVAGDPEDPPNFPGYNADLADSIAPVVDVSGTSGGGDEDGDQAFGFDDDDLGGVDDDSIGT
ncbi:hypothetical protein D1007_41328 [Hordeum vulgare]|nr:hypothetical protein D1007_41328 [Hordeum vulgare]